MITHNDSMPIKDLEGKSLSNTNHKWKHGEEWFEYARNSDGYRSEEFQQNPNFLFAGCSETFGESAEYETTWAYKLFNKLKQEEDSYCNVGMPGIDVSIVILNIMMFIEKYGKPKNIFVIFPGFNRIVESSSKDFATVTLFPEEERHDIQQGPIMYESGRIVDIVRSVNMIQIKNFEMICKELGVNLIWSTWDLKSSSQILKYNNFNKYVSIVNDKDIASHATNMSNNPRALKLTRADGYHHGELFHDYWSNVFYSNYKEKLK